MTQYLDLDGLKKFKEKADAEYKPIKGTIPLTDKINLTTETKASLALKYAKVTNNTVNFYIIADSSNKLPSSETRININSDITELVGAEGANVGDIFVIGKLNLLPVYKIIPLNDAKAANSDFKGTQGIVTPWDKTQINKVPNLESAISAAKNNLPTYSESNMNNALKTGFYPWCTLGRPSGSTGAYTLVTLASTTADNNGYTTIEQTAYGRQNNELGKIFKRIIFKPSSGDTEYGEWKEVTGGGSSDLAFGVDESITDADKALEVGCMYPAIREHLPDGFDNYTSRLYVFGLDSSDCIQLLTDYGAQELYIRRYYLGEFIGGWVKFKTLTNDDISRDLHERASDDRKILQNDYDKDKIVQFVWKHSSLESFPPLCLDFDIASVGLLETDKITPRVFSAKNFPDLKIINIDYSDEDYFKVTFNLGKSIPWASDPSDMSTLKDVNFILDPTMTYVALKYVKYAI